MKGFNVACCKRQKLTMCGALARQKQQRPSMSKIEVLRGPELPCMFKSEVFTAWIFVKFSWGLLVGFFPLKFSRNTRSGTVFLNLEVKTYIFTSVYVH